MPAQGRLMFLRREQGTEFAECATRTGTLRAWVLARDVYATQGEGHMQDEHFEFIKAYGEERIRRAGGKVYVFHDWTEMTGYDSSSRVKLTSWSIAHRDCFQEAHLAVRSRVIVLGVQVANIAVGGFMRAHSGTASLEIELDRVLRRGSSLAPSPPK